MKILFVLDELPFPARNGITFTASNHIKILSKNHDVSLLYLANDPAHIDQAQLEMTRGFIPKVHIAVRSRHSRLLSILSELLFIKPVFSCYDVDFPDSLDDDYDIFWGCPVRTLETIFTLKKRSQYQDTKTLLCVNEPYSLTLNKRNQVSSRGFILHALSRFATLFRSFVMLRHERKIFRRLDQLIVQSDHEVEWVKNNISYGIACKTSPIPNGVDDHLLESEGPKKTQALFVGDLSIEYFHKMVWFLENVWRPVTNQLPTAILTVVGGSASRELIDIFQHYNIKYLGYVDDLREVFEEHSIVVAPVYKGGGIITKVIEAMACGCIVVGDKTAFSGIDTFVDGVHGLVAKDKDDFSTTLINLLSNNTDCMNIGLQARSLMSDHFQWESRRGLLEEVLKV